MGRGQPAGLPAARYEKEGKESRQVRQGTGNSRLTLRNWGLVLIPGTVCL